MKPWSTQLPVYFCCFVLTWGLKFIKLYLFLQQQSQVPKFGNWESEEDVPYTVYFDNARKGKKGGKMNPNDPQEYLDTESKGQKGPEATRTKHVRRISREDGDLRKSIDSPLHSDAMSEKSANESHHHRQGGSRYASSKSESEGPKGADMARPRPEHQLSREEADLRRPTDSPLRNETANRRPTHDSPHPRYGGLSAGDTPKKVARQSVGSDHSIEHSPLHPHSQARTGGKGSGVSSPSWERKVLSEGGHGLAPSTPGRSRLRSVTRGDETVCHSHTFLRMALEMIMHADK